ncbi:MAG: hypothetical protein IJ113_03160 [Eggerthellaceae bacterium]|nr:hypothetical protein [Eggerthellaceae bacterium]
MGEPVLDDYKSYIVLHYLYTSIEAVCLHIGDMGPLEYALLTEIAEMPQGFSLQGVQESYGLLWGNCDHSIALLEEKELVERRRLEQDRRKFAIHATLKGHNRINAIDEAFAFSLVDSTARITEARFEQFVAQLHALQAQDPSRVAAGIIPSYPLRILCFANQYLVQECTRLDMSVSEFVVLCALRVFPQGLSEEAIRRRLGVSAGGSIAASVLDVLEEKHLVRRAVEVTITEEGRDRAALILDRLRAKILQAFERVGAEQRETLVAAIESCLYLFA